MNIEKMLKAAIFIEHLWYLLLKQLHFLVLEVSYPVYLCFPLFQGIWEIIEWGKYSTKCVKILSGQ